MRNKISIFTVLAIVFAMSANATVWRVSNTVVNGIPIDADFSTLQDAINGAATGDTIYLMGSPTTYGDGVFDKQLVVIGPGYFLNDNDTTQAHKLVAQVRFLTFNDGSQGSVIQGLRVYPAQNSGTYQLITINTDNITIRKNFIFELRDSEYTAGVGYCIVIGNN